MIDSCNYDLGILLLSYITTQDIATNSNNFYDMCKNLHY